MFFDSPSDGPGIPSSSIFRISTRTHPYAKKEVLFTKILCQQTVLMLRFIQSDRIMRTLKHEKVLLLMEKLNVTRMEKKSDIQLFYLQKKKRLRDKFVLLSRDGDFISTLFELDLTMKVNLGI